MKSKVGILIMYIHTFFFAILPWNFVRIELTNAQHQGFTHNQNL